MTVNYKINISFWLVAFFLLANLEAATYGNYFGIYGSAVKSLKDPKISIQNNKHELTLKGGAVLEDGAKLFAGTEFNADAFKTAFVNHCVDTGTSFSGSKSLKAYLNSILPSSTNKIPPGTAEITLDFSTTTGSDGASEADKYTLQSAEILTIPLSSAVVDSKIKPDGSTAMTAEDVTTSVLEQSGVLQVNKKIMYEGGLQVGTTYNNMQFEFSASKNRLNFFNASDKKLFYTDNFDFFLNGAVVIDLSAVLIPYVGAGLGLQYSILNVEKATASATVAGSDTPKLDDLKALEHSLNFLYQGIVGCNVAITSKTAISLEYKFRSSIANEGNEYKDDKNVDKKVWLKNSNHFITFGMKVLF